MEIPVEPIIDETIWKKAKAQKELRTPAKSGRNPSVRGSKTLLTGLAVCGLCGKSVALETAQGGKYTYYNCSNYFRRGKSACPGQRIPAHDLEQVFLDHLVHKLFSKERVKQILKDLYRELKESDKRNDSQKKSLIRQFDDVGSRLKRQYEAIESGKIDLGLVGDRIAELKEQRDQIQNRLDELKRASVIPLHFFKDESIQAFQNSLTDMFLRNGDRAMVKRYLQLFVEKVVINLPKVEIVAKPDVVLAVLENKKAVRTDDVLTAIGSWLPSTDSNRGPDG
ncbi:MAG: recombinase zinc beta ribbon domain-containing protein [Desulfobacterales bacterium]|nr:MAG: recombinase zinc beta ribbon domain-containing protein [Desulfobacterales bacterium]